MNKIDDFKLRAWVKEDLNDLAKHACNEKITKFMSDGFPNTREKCEKFLDYVVGNNELLYFAIDINGEAVGGIGISQNSDIKRKNAELGYWLSEEHWGKGIMSKAIKEIVRIAFDKLDINRIYASPFETNYASHRILEKAGFKLEARFDKIVFKNGQFLDELVYSFRYK